MKHLFLSLKIVILLVIDFLLWFLALTGALLIRFKGQIDLEIWQNNFESFFLFFFLWLAVFVIFDLYNIRKFHDKIKYFSTFFQALVLSSILSIIIFYISTFKYGFTPRTILLLHVLLFTIFIICWRLIFISILKKAKYRKNIAIVGFSQEVKDAVEEVMLRFKDSKVKLIFNIDNNFECENFCNLTKIKNYHQKSVKNSIKIFKENNIDEVIVANKNLDNQVKDNLIDCLALGIDIVALSDFYEKSARKINLSSIDQIWFLNKIHEGSKKLFESTKRIFDFIIAIFVLIIFLITFPLFAFIIKIDSKGPVFFTQIRSGRFGREFRLIKYRTMVENAENQGQAVWAQKNDKRITRVGRLMRKTRIDELPQCVNILKGEMSFVGPRPERPEFIERLEQEIPFYKQRLLIKPGLTGWAQVNYPYAASIEDSWKKMQYDLYYLKNRSLMLDLVIILRTIEVILLTKGQ